MIPLLGTLRPWDLGPHLTLLFLKEHSIFIFGNLKKKLIKSKFIVFKLYEGLQESLQLFNIS